MSYKELPTPDPKKITRYHDNYRDALIDEALDDMERKLITGNFLEQNPNKYKEANKNE